MTLKDLLLRNRSVRAFRQDMRLTEAELRELVDLTRLCPSSGNMQPLKYRIVTAGDELRAMAPCLRWGGILRTPKLPPEGQGPTAYIVIVHDLRESPKPEAFLRDVGLCAHTLLLGAAEKGFSGCMLGAFRADGVSEALGLEDHQVPALVVALGKSAETICLEDAPPGLVSHDRCYWRDERNIHHVWKRPLEELLVAGPGRTGNGEGASDEQL